ncbi:hypothetical protein QG37_06297 [Candidozyma auris]|nr:hypothetical protein QG37_06297 [[Candida] auris]
MRVASSSKSWRSHDPAILIVLHILWRSGASGERENTPWRPDWTVWRISKSDMGSMEVVVVFWSDFWENQS